MPEYRTKMKTCQNCGKKKNGVRKIIDPYKEDVYDVKEEMYLCRKCEQERREDI